MKVAGREGKHGLCTGMRSAVSAPNTKQSEESEDMTDTPSTSNRPSGFSRYRSQGLRCIPAETRSFRGARVVRSGAYAMIQRSMLIEL